MIVTSSKILVQYIHQNWLQLPVTCVMTKLCKLDESVEN